MTTNGKVVEAQNRTNQYLQKIAASIDFCVVESNLELNLDGYGENTKYCGKVRNKLTFPGRKCCVMVATDRQSAFDRPLAAIPFKGAVLNMTSAWWFKKTSHIIDNHVIAVPDPNVTIVKLAKVFPVEFVVRGYITGSTSTSMWTNYSKGIRNYCGVHLPDGLQKNQKLWQNLVTPTTKDEVHDELISPTEIVSNDLMSQEDWDVCCKAALNLFEFGQKTAAERGLILVDTKYEFGKTEDGRIILVDEIHTPDSSRYWIASSYDERFAQGLPPENIDKEFLRLWFVEHCDPYKDKVLPEAPKDLVCELSRRYILLYELITGETFNFNMVLSGQSALARVRTNVRSWASREWKQT